MGDFKVMYKGPTHQFEIQIPILFGNTGLNLPTLNAGSDDSKTDETPSVKSTTPSVVEDTISAASIGVIIASTLVNALTNK